MSGKMETDEGKAEKCPICLDKITDKRKTKCGHEFCAVCLQESIKCLGEICPVCKKILGTLMGNQPDGEMDVHKWTESLPGYPHCGTIEIDYFIPSGIQMDDHPNPGQMYTGTQHQAYLLDNHEGQQVLKLLQRAFDQRLTFTVGVSISTGEENTVIWNDIHHKTCSHGGPQGHGYPDPDYLKRVREELKAKGIE